MVLLSGLFLTCSKDEIKTAPNPIDKVTGKCVNDSPTLSNWHFDFGQGFHQRHTQGLRTMARSGNTAVLDSEWCGLGNYSKKIPNGLEDDPEGDGYAGQIVLGDYIVAMYHPRTWPDHFITYNHTNGTWIRWAEGNSPEIFRKSD